MVGFPEINYMVYGYANARVHGMKGLLLSHKIYTELSNLKSVEAMVEYLHKTHHKESLLNATTRYSGSQLIEYASGVHYAEVVSKIKKITPDKDKEIIDAFLTKWDIINLKVVVASKNTTSNFSDVVSKLIPVGLISKSVLERIYNANNRDFISEIKRTALGSELFSQNTSDLSVHSLSRLKEAIKSHNQYSQIHIILDNYAYHIVENHLKKYISNKQVRLVYERLRDKISSKNILVIERLKRSGIKDPKKIKSYLIAGGSLSLSVLDKIISFEKFSDLVSFIKQRSEFSNFDNGEPKTLLDLENELARLRSRKILMTFHRSILSLGTLLGFILLKEEEMNNLRKIARAKEFGVKPEEVMKTLVYP